LIPLCAGIGIVGYSDTAPKTSASDKSTSPLGVVFAFTALVVSATYTVWIGKYHKALDYSSVQLLLNQTPVSVLIMLYVVPFADNVTA
jgi:solute carrier family 35 protein E3